MGRKSNNQTNTHMMHFLLAAFRQLLLFEMCKLIGLYYCFIETGK